MIVLQWIRFLLGTGFLLCGILVFGIELFGVFKFRYVLIILNGWNFTSVKMILVVVFLWFASPVASHVLARFEVATNEKSEGCYEDKTTKV